MAVHAAMIDRMDQEIGRVFEEIMLGNFLHPPTLMIRRKAFAETGPFSPDLRNACDYEWLIRACRDHVAGFIDAPLIRYRLHPGQMSGDHNTAPIRLDTLRILDRWVGLEPALSPRRNPRMRRRIAQVEAAAAEVLVESNRGQAWRHFARALSMGGPPARLARTLVKLLMPQAVVDGIRRRRGTAPAAKTTPAA